MYVCMCVFRDGDKELYKQLSSLRDIPVVIDTLLANLNPTLGEEVGVAEDEDMEEDIDGFVGELTVSQHWIWVCRHVDFVCDLCSDLESNLLKTLKGLFGGSVAMTTLSSSLLEVCRYRLCLCRDVLVALVMLRRRAGREVRGVA